MEQTLPRILFFGNERIATGVATNNLILRQLIDDGYDIAAIVVNHEATERKHKVRQLEIASIAQAHDIPLHKPEKLVDIADQLAAYNADVAVLVAYGKMVPQRIIDIFPAGIINVHPSLLPKHRGSTPIESAILDGDRETGVSLMQLVSAMDAGPIYAQSSLLLTGQESKQDLADTLLEIAARMLHDLLPDILQGTVVALPQDEVAATYDERIAKQDGRLDWRKPAERLTREIRAYAEWPKSTTRLGDIDVVVTAAHAATSQPGRPGSINLSLDTGGIHISCAEGSLIVDQLKPAGKKEMTAAEFMRGYGQRLN